MQGETLQSCIIIAMSRKPHSFAEFVCKYPQALQPSPAGWLSYAVDTQKQWMRTRTVHTVISPNSSALASVVQYNIMHPTTHAKNCDQNLYSLRRWLYKLRYSNAHLPCTFCHRRETERDTNTPATPNIRIVSEYTERKREYTLHP